MGGRASSAALTLGHELIQGLGEALSTTKVEPTIHGGPEGYT